MKFKTLFILLNALLVFSFATIITMPFFIIGADYFATFLKTNWILLATFGIVFVGLNIFFIYNRKLFNYIETEAWEPLLKLLHKKIFEKKRYTARNIRLYINAALLRGKLDEVLKLEEILKNKKPLILKKHALLFGAIHLLHGKPADSMAFFESFNNTTDIDNVEWFVFYGALAKVMAKEAGKSKQSLEASLKSKDRILRLMAAFVLSTMCAPHLSQGEKEQAKAIAETERKELAAVYTTHGGTTAEWAKELEKAKSELYIVILSKTLDDASTWMLQS